MGAELHFGEAGMILESPAAATLCAAWFKPFEGLEGRARVRLRFASFRDPRRWVALAFRGRGGEDPRYDLFTVRAAPAARSGLELCERAARRFAGLRRTSWSAGAFDPLRPHELEVVLRGGRVRCRLDGQTVLEEWTLPARDAGRFGIVVSGARVIVSGFAAGALTAAERSSFAAIPPPPRAILIGHRGVARDAPENTLASLRLAVERGADGVEFDVWASADGRAVLMHDETLRRTTNIEEVNAQRAPGDRIPPKITAATWKQLQALDAGSWKGERFRGEPVPLLYQALELLRGHAVAIIEIKDVRIARRVAKLVRDARMVGSCCVISFHPEALEQIHAELPEASAALLVGDEGCGAVGAAQAEELVARARRVHASCISTNWKWISPAFGRRVRALGMTLACWTVDDPQRARFLLRCGVAMLTTNAPGALRRALWPRAGG